jgi:hypothetical protein
MLGAIAYVAYRKAKRKNRVSKVSSPETDARIETTRKGETKWDTTQEDS